MNKIKKILNYYIYNLILILKKSASKLKIEININININNISVLLYYKLKYII